MSAVRIRVYDCENTKGAFDLKIWQKSGYLIMILT